MPRQVVVFCDPCYGSDKRSEAQSYVVRVGVRRTDKAKELLLCDEHATEILGPLLEVMEAALTYDAEAPGVPAGPLPGLFPAPAGPEAGTRARGASTTPSPGAPPGHMAPPVTNPPADLPAPETGAEGETIWECQECKKDPDAEPVVFSTKDRKRPAQSIRLHLRQLHKWDV